MSFHVCSALYHMCGLARGSRSVMLYVSTRVRDTCDIIVDAVALAGVFDITVIYMCVCRRCEIARQRLGQRFVLVTHFTFVCSLRHTL